MSTGTLSVVPTPIGNLEDMTYRAVHILKQVDAIVCEDTREARKLLTAYDIIIPPLFSYHSHTPESREQHILSLLLEGKHVALMSDRGTPGISDPGSRLVRQAIEQGISVVPLPGASACITALSASGADTTNFWFRGFIPHKKGRQTFIEECLQWKGTIVFYESPHRILKCLAQCIERGIADRPIILARELTKIHEEFLRGSTADLLAVLQSRPTVRGEYIVIIDAQGSVTTSV